MFVKVSELVVKYNREQLTVWGNSSDQIVRKCYKEVSCQLKFIFIQSWGKKKSAHSFHFFYFIYRGLNNSVVLINFYEQTDNLR